jgi:hypothetical protein
MKISLTLSIPLILLLAGCGGQEPAAEAPVVTEEAPAERSPVKEEAETTLGSLAQNLQAHAETVSEKVKDVANAEEKKQHAEKLVTNEADLPEYSPEDDAARNQYNSLLQSDTTQQLISSLSWDKVSELPFSDREALAGFAEEKVSEWKGRLQEAAMSKGTQLLGSLGDTGWEKALRDVVSGIQRVKEANPETWESARSALVQSWAAFEAQALAFIEGES